VLVAVAVAVAVVLVAAAAVVVLVHSQLARHQHLFFFGSPGSSPLADVLKRYLGLCAVPSG
jgi:hypothetical protein